MPAPDLPVHALPPWRNQAGMRQAQMYMRDLTRLRPLNSGDMEAHGSATKVTLAGRDNVIQMGPAVESDASCEVWIPPYWRTGGSISFKAHYSLSDTGSGCQLQLAAAERVLGQSIVGAPAFTDTDALTAVVVALDLAAHTWSTQLDITGAGEYVWFRFRRPDNDGYVGDLYITHSLLTFSER